MKQVNKETIIRTVILTLALINQVLAACGKSPIPVDEESITELISTGITVIAAVWAWWKNNSFTQAAIKADEQLTQAKRKYRK